MKPRSRRNQPREIGSIASALRESAGSESPDFTGDILSRVDSERPFLNRRTRRASGSVVLGWA